jgi:hypothetical protein
LQQKLELRPEEDAANPFRKVDGVEKEAKMTTGTEHEASKLTYLFGNWITGTKWLGLLGSIFLAFLIQLNSQLSVPETIWKNSHLLGIALDLNSRRLGANYH